MANNMANASTAGFKASRPVYNGSTLDADTDPNQVNQTYVNIPDVYTQFSDGPLVATGNTFDLAIEGSGFFVVSTPNGTMYTRTGQFSLNVDKKLVTQNGNPVMGQNGGEITIDGKNVSIAADGYDFRGRLGGRQAQGCRLFRQAVLEELRGKLFVNVNTKNGETAAEKSSVKQGDYETSNVDTMKEMVDMIAP